MIKKIIGAVSLFIVFVVTFALGVGFIVRGAGDFSWDIVSEYVSMSDIVMINDSPISNLFSFSDHSSVVGSHAEGQIACPTVDGRIEIYDIPAEMTIVASEDEMIHLTFDGDVRKSCVVDAAANLTGDNIPDLVFEYNDSTDKATIRFKNLRIPSKTNTTPKLTIAIPASYVGNVLLKDIAGKAESTVPMTFAQMEIKDVAGKVELENTSAKTLVVSDVTGRVALTAGIFEEINLDDAAGKVEISGSVGRFSIDNIVGSVKIESEINITDNCTVNNIVGTVDITLPTGSKIQLKKNEVVGVAIATNTDKKAAYTITVSNIVGKVFIKN